MRSIWNFRKRIWGKEWPKRCWWRWGWGWGWGNVEGFLREEKGNLMELGCWLMVICSYMFWYLRILFLHGLILFSVSVWKGFAPGICQDKVCLGNDLNQLCADVDVPWQCHAVPEKPMVGHRGWHGGSMWIYVLKLSQDVTGSTGSTVVTLQVYDRIIYSSFSRKWDIGLL